MYRPLRIEYPTAYYHVMIRAMVDNINDRATHGFSLLPKCPYFLVPADRSRLSHTAINL